MLTIRYIVYKHYVREDGLFPIKLRITKNRQSAYLDTIFTARRNQLSGNLDRIRDIQLERRVVEYESDLYDKIYSKYKDYINLTAKEIKARIQNIPVCTPKIVPFWHEYVAKLKSEGRGTTAANYNSALRRFTEYAGEDLTFNDIDRQFLAGYERDLRDKVKSRGVELYLSCLRRVYNEAYTLYSETMDNFNKSPFETYSIPTSEPTQKRDLSVANLAKVLSYTPSSEIEQLAIDSFKVSLYLCGVITSDIYQLPDIVDGRVTYNRAKTAKKRKDHSLTSVAWPAELDDVLHRHKGSDGKLFDFSARYSCAANYNKAVSKGLMSVRAKLGMPKLQFYCARHSFATIARKNGVSVDDISLALVHSQSSVTDIYIHNDFTRNDKTNRIVIDAVEKALRNLSAEGVAE